MHDAANDAFVLFGLCSGPIAVFLSDCSDCSRSFSKMNNDYSALRDAMHQDKVGMNRTSCQRRAVTSTGYSVQCTVQSVFGFCLKFEGFCKVLLVQIYRRWGVLLRCHLQGSVQHLGGGEAICISPWECWHGDQERFRGRSVGSPSLLCRKTNHFCGAIFSSCCCHFAWQMELHTFQLLSDSVLCPPNFEIPRVKSPFLSFQWWMKVMKLESWNLKLKTMNYEAWHEEKQRHDTMAWHNITTKQNRHIVMSHNMWIVNIFILYYMFCFDITNNMTWHKMT